MLWILLLSVGTSQSYPHAGMRDSWLDEQMASFQLTLNSSYPRSGLPGFFAISPYMSDQYPADEYMQCHNYYRRICYQGALARNNTMLAYMKGAINAYKKAAGKVFYTAFRAGLPDEFLNNTQEIFRMFPSKSKVDETLQDLLRSPSDQRMSYEVLTEFYPRFHALKDFGEFSIGQYLSGKDPFVAFDKTRLEVVVTKIVNLYVKLFKNAITSKPDDAIAHIMEMYTNRMKKYVPEDKIGTTNIAVQKYKSFMEFYYGMIKDFPFYHQSDRELKETIVKLAATKLTLMQTINLKQAGVEYQDPYTGAQRPCTEKTANFIKYFNWFDPIPKQFMEPERYKYKEDFNLRNDYFMEKTREHSFDFAFSDKVLFALAGEEKAPLAAWYASIGVEVAMFLLFKSKQLESIEVRNFRNQNECFDSLREIFLHDKASKFQREQAFYTPAALAIAATAFFGELDKQKSAKFKQEAELFFRAYTASNCEDVLETSQTKYEYHNKLWPRVLTVNTPLARYPVFAKFYKCNENDPMNKPLSTECNFFAKTLVEETITKISQKL